MHFQGGIAPSAFPGSPDNQLTTDYSDFPSSAPSYVGTSFYGLWLGPPYISAFTGQMRLQLNAPHGALLPVYWSNGDPVMGEELATTQIALAGKYDPNSNSWVLYSTRPITDAVAREKALTGDMRVEIAVEGNLTQALDSDGNRLVSVVGATEDVGYEASKAIDGSRVPKDYLNDLDNHYWKSPNPQFGPFAWGIFNLGSQKELNAVTVYQHPTLPMSTSPPTPIGSVSRYIIYGRNSVPAVAEPSLASGWDLIAAVDTNSQVIIDPNSGSLILPSKVETRLRDSVAYQYVAFKAGNVSSLDDFFLRVCEIELYNWVDVSPRVVWEDGKGPSIDIEKTSDSSQTSVPTPSECRINFVNADGYFTPGNPSSPIYGTTQVDGRGSGIRAGTPVRVTDLMTGADGIPRSKQKFDGIVANDQGVGGPLAIQVDEDSKQALLVCKGLATFLSQLQDSPVYEGSWFSNTVADLVARSGVARQDTRLGSIWQAVPFVSFDRQTALDSMKSIGEALPFFRVFERHDPAAIEITNKGRSRADLSFERFTGETRNNSINNIPDLYTLLAENISRNTAQPYCTSRMLHDGDNHYFWRNTRINVVGRASSTAPAPQVDYSPLLGPCRVYRWNETGPVSDSNLAADSYNHNSSFYDKVSQWAAIINGNMYEITSNYFITGYEGPRMRSAPLAADGTLTFSTLGTIGLVTPQFESLVSAISYGSTIFYITFRPTAAQFNNWMDSLRFYVWDVNTGFGSRVNKGTDTGTSMDVRHLIANGSYLAYTQFTQSTALRIWNHAGNPTVTPLSFVTRNFFSFGTLDPSNGNNYADPSIPRCRYFLADDGYLYCAAQPKKVNNLFRYEVWRVLMSDLAAGTATATLMGILADDVSDDISDLVVKNGVVYVLDRFSMWAWDSTKPIVQKFDLGTAFQHVPSKRKDSGYNVTSNNPARIPPPFYNGVLSRTRPYFLHQGTLEVQNNRVINGTATRGMGWSNRYTDCGPETPAIDEKGRVWVMVGENTGGVNYSNELRAFSISQDQFDINPAVAFDISDGFTITMKIPDGSPDANSIKMDVNPFRLDTQVSDVWTQQNDDPTTFPAGESTTIEIPMNTLSGRGSGNNTSTHRYLRLNGQNIFDDPDTVVPMTIENIIRGVTFWALGRKAFLTIDNTGKPACQMAGAVIRATAIVPRFSSSVVVRARSEASIRLYGREFFLDLSNEYVNDPTFVRDLLLAGEYARLYAETVSIPWYPIMEPGDVVSLTDLNEGVNGEPFEIVAVRHSGFTTKFAAKQVRPAFVI